MTLGHVGAINDLMTLTLGHCLEKKNIRGKVGMKKRRSLRRRQSSKVRSFGCVAQEPWQDSDRYQLRRRWRDS